MKRREGMKRRDVRSYNRWTAIKDMAEKAGIPWLARIANRRRYLSAGRL